MRRLAVTGVEASVAISLPRRCASGLRLLARRSPLRTLLSFKWFLPKTHLVCNVGSFRLLELLWASLVHLLSTCRMSDKVCHAILSILYLGSINTLCGRCFYCFFLYQVNSLFFDEDFSQSKSNIRKTKEAFIVPFISFYA